MDTPPRLSRKSGCYTHLPPHPALAGKDGAGTGSAGPSPTLSPATRGLGGPITPPMCCGDQRAQPGPRPRPPPSSAQGPRAAWDSEARGSHRPLPAHVTSGSPASSLRSSAGSGDPATLARGGGRGRDLHRDVARAAPDTAPRAPGRRPTPREARAAPRSGPQAVHRPSRYGRGRGAPAPASPLPAGPVCSRPAAPARPRGRLTALVSARRRARSSRDTARTPDMSARHSAVPPTPAPGRACAARRRPGPRGAPGHCACADRSRGGGAGRPRPALAAGVGAGTRAAGGGGACGRPRGGEGPMTRPGSGLAPGLGVFADAPDFTCGPGSVVFRVCVSARDRKPFVDGSGVESRGGRECVPCAPCSPRDRGFLNAFSRGCAQHDVELC